MKNARYLIIAFITLLASCEKILMEPDPANNPETNFEVLWNTMDEKYSLFPYKQINWDTLYVRYRPRVNPGTTPRELFNIMEEMLFELKDGHVNLVSPFDTSYYNEFYNHVPRNFEPSFIFRDYLKGNFIRDGALVYGIIGSAGYIMNADFSKDLTEKAMDRIVGQFTGLKGVIIDVRSNGGGNEQNGNIMASRFFDHKRIVEYNHIKGGPEHDNLVRSLVFLEPDGEKQYTGPTVILSNRRCYSATNTFISRMSVLPHVTIAGDTTGGGGGSPYHSELPNGWVYRFSSTFAMRPDGLNIDEGVPPDHLVYFKHSDILRRRDPILEFALDLIHE